MPRASLAAISTLLLILILGVPAQAQTTDVTGDQAPPVPGVGHDYIKLLNETVNPANGAVSIRISVPAPAGRGITVPFSFGYDSNSALHFVPTGWIDNSAYLSKGGWSYVVPRLSQATNASGQQGSVCYYYTNYMFTDLQAQSHALYMSPIEQINAAQGCANYDTLTFVPSNTLTGTDGLVQATTVSPTATQVPNGPPVSVADADGTVYYFSMANPEAIGGTQSFLPDWIEDRNGNKVTFTDHGHGVFTINDTLGRAVISASAFGTTDDQITISGLTNPYQVTWGSITPTTYPVSIPTSITTMGNGICATGTAVNEPAPFPIVTAIELPNGHSYQFQYDPLTTMLSKITYPTGGYVRYTWETTPLSEYAIASTPASGGTCTNFEEQYSTLAVKSRYVSFDGSHEVMEQDFTYSPTWVTGTTYPHVWSQKATTVVTKDLVRGTSFQTIYTYVPYALPRTPNVPTYITGSQSTPVESQIQYYDTNGALLRTVDKTSSPLLPPSVVTTILPNLQTSQTQIHYSSFSGPLTLPQDKYEYDFGPNGSPGALIRHQNFAYASLSTPIFPQPASYPTSPVPAIPSILDRPTKIITYDGSANRVAETDYAYDQTQAGSISPSPTGHDEANYGGSKSPSRGNATTVTKICLIGLQACTNAITTFTYDETGHVASKKDACGNGTCADMLGTQHAVTYLYADNYASCNGNAPPNGSTNAYLTKITDPLEHFQQFCYGYDDGQVRGATDQNGQTKTYVYRDNLARLTEINNPDNGHTLYTYNDTPPTPTVTTQKELETGGGLLGFATYVTTVNTTDGMGHVTQTQLTSDPDGTDTTIKTYDGSGRILTATNPYRSTSDSTYGTTSYTYDGLGRVTAVSNPGDGLTPVKTSYSNNCTTVTDEAGISRKSCTDGLGRMNSVTEDPSGLGYVTTYQYDTLSDMTSVVQNASRQRSFIYNSFAELTSSTNPESNTTPSSQTPVPTTYQYDPNGNLASKTVPAQNQQNTATATLSYCYDALNRITSKAYTSQTCPMNAPAATYSYDNSACLGQSTCFNVGRRTGMTDAAGTESWSYDNMGRILVDQRTTNGITKSTVYTYAPYVDGSINSLTYPSGRVITYTTGAAERMLSAVDSAINYATGAHYVPSGALSAVENGGILNSTNIYNNRLQPCWTYTTTSTALATTSTCTASDSTPGNILDLKYIYSSFAHPNNDDVIGITNNRDTTRSQSFTYDTLNRISVAETTSTYATGPTSCWGESYGYDAWGNLLSISSPSSSYTNCVAEGTLSLSANPQNQIVGDTYDSSGNMLSPALSGSTYSYNAENQMTQAATSAGITGYVYDGDGRRIEKVAGGTVAKIYWYGSRSQALDETDGTGSPTNSSFYEYIFFGDSRIARRDFSGNTSYYFADHLSTARTMAQVLTGQNTATLCYDADFYPFGGERSSLVSSCVQPYKFTGKERDSESGLDDFGARYYSSSLGRFMIPDWAATPEDVPYANFGDPQSLNLYEYVRNNPLSHVDSDGHDTINTTQWTWSKLGSFAVGYAKGAVNLAVSALNTTPLGIAANLVSGGKPGQGVIPELKPSNQDEAHGMMGATTGAALALPFVAPEAVAGETGGLADGALVVRGGVATAEQLTKGAESIASDGTLNGVSVQSANGATVEQLSQGIPNNQISVSSVGDVRAAGGSVVQTPKAANPCHCDMNGLDANEASKLFKVRPNPNKVPGSQ